MFDLEYLRVLYYFAEFLQLDSPAALFYLALVVLGFFGLSRWCLLLSRKENKTKIDLTEIKGELIKITAILEQQDLRADMLKNIIIEQENRHSQYRVNLSEINNRIDNVQSRIDRVRETA